MKKSQLLIAALLAAGAASAQAGSYAGLDAGWARVDQKPLVDELGQALADASGHTVYVTYDQATSAGRVFAGWNVSDNMDIELGYLASGDLEATYTGTTAGNAAFSVNTAFDVTGFDLAAIYWPTKNVFLKAGVHNTEIAGTLSANVSGSTASYSVSQSGTGGLIGAGYEAEAGNNLTWRLAYTFYQSLGGASDADAHIYTVGVKYKF